MKRVLQTIVRDNERYSVSNSSELSISKPDLYIEKIELQGGATATTEDIVVTRSGINLLDKSKFHATQTKNGITFTNNGDGTITVNGTATARTVYYFYEKIIESTSNKFLLSGTPKGASYTSYWMEAKCYDNEDNLFYLQDIGNGRISIKQLKRISDCHIVIVSGQTVSNLVFKPQLYDLTAIYGEGNEPTTVKQFLNDFPNYEPYLPPKSLTFSSAYPLSSTDKLSITRQSVKYNDMDITSEVTGLDEFFGIDANVSTVITNANIALGEITEDISYSVKSNKRAILDGDKVIYSSQTFIKE